METLTVQNIIVGDKRIEVSFEPSDGLKPFFNFEQAIFWLEYSENVSRVPPCIAIIPFVCNVLPIIWLNDAKLILPSLDESFYNSINEFKEGYLKMYPMLNFRGMLDIKELVNNTYNTTGGNAAFFSGGVDAFTTLICHRKEHPTLITLRGSDLKLDDETGWENVRNHLYKTIDQFNLPTPICITSNFRTFIDEAQLDGIVSKSTDGWWHGFQHGIGIISQAAPVAYLKHFNIVYIASSNTKNEITTCASDPTIDNHIKFGSTSVVHDQYEKNRQQKIKTIVDYSKSSEQAIDTRVCWISRGGKNCCRCEKCFRTMFAFMAEGESPRNYGFNYNDNDLNKSRDIVTEALYHTNDTVRGNWSYTIGRFKETGAYKNDQRINWIYEFNPYAPPPQSSFVNRLFHVIRRIIHCV